MYVCICNRYREADIRAAAVWGEDSVETIYRRLGNGPRCGRCLDFAAGVVERARQQAGGRDAA